MQYNYCDTIIQLGLNQLSMIGFGIIIKRRAEFHIILWPKQTLSFIAVLYEGGYKRGMGQLSRKGANVNTLS